MKMGDDVLRSEKSEKSEKIEESEKGAAEDDRNTADVPLDGDIAGNIDVNIDGNLDAFWILCDLMKPVPETDVGKLINEVMVGVAMPRVVANIREVTDQMFENRRMTWGRVVVLYAYAARVASMYGDLATCAKVVGAKTSDWIESVGGWAAFPVERPRSCRKPWWGQWLEYNWG
jgi:hypothetical protein